MGRDGGEPQQASCSAPSSSKPRAYLQAAQAQAARGEHAKALSLAVKAAAVPAAPDSAPLAAEALRLAAESALLCSHPAKALKYASRLVCCAMSLNPQDMAPARLLAQRCTLEMEHDARARDLLAALMCSSGGSGLGPAAAFATEDPQQQQQQQPALLEVVQEEQEGAAHVAAGVAHFARIQALLDELLADDDAPILGSDGDGALPPHEQQQQQRQQHPADVLDQLTLVVEHGGVQAQIAFHLASGYPSAIAFFPAYPQHVSRLLVAAGTCALFSAKLASSSGGAAAAATRVRWPQLVLQRLLGAALDWEQQPVLARQAMRLLAHAARDPQLRGTGFVAPPTWWQQASATAAVSVAAGSGSQGSVGSGSLCGTLTSGVDPNGTLASSASSSSASSAGPWAGAPPAHLLPSSFSVAAGQEQGPGAELTLRPPERRESGAEEEPATAAALLRRHLSEVPSVCSPLHAAGLPLQQPFIASQGEPDGCPSFAFPAADAPPPTAPTPHQQHHHRRTASDCPAFAAPPLAAHAAAVVLRRSGSTSHQAPAAAEGKPPPHRAVSWGAGALQAPSAQLLLPEPQPHATQLLATAVAAAGASKALLQRRASSVGARATAGHGDDAPACGGAAAEEAPAALPAPESVLTRLLVELSRRAAPAPSPASGANGRPPRVTWSGGAHAAPAAAPWTAAEPLPAELAACALEVISSFCSDAQGQHMLAGTHHALSATMGLALALHPPGATSLAPQQPAAAYGEERRGGAAGERATCCRWAQEAAWCMQRLVAREPGLLVLEAFGSLSRGAGAHAGGSHGGNGSAPPSPPRAPPFTGARQQAGAPSPSPSPLLRGLVQHVRMLVERSPECVQPEVGWDGQVRGFGRGKRPADPCHVSSTPRPGSACSDGPGGAASVASATNLSRTSSGRALVPSSSLGEGGGRAPSMLQAWVELLGCAAASSRSVARELDAQGALELLHGVAQRFGHADRALLSTSQRALACMAVGSHSALHEAVDEGMVHALLGTALHGLRDYGSAAATPASDSAAAVAAPCHHEVRQQRRARQWMEAALRALDKLAQLLDACNGADFLELVSPDGLLRELHALLLPRQPPGGSTAAAAGAECARLLGPLHDAGRCVFLGALERARRAAQLGPTKAPRVGWFGTLKPKELLQLEARVRAEWAAAILPRSPPRLPQAPTAPPPHAPSPRSASADAPSHTTTAPASSAPPPSTQPPPSPARKPAIPKLPPIASRWQRLSASGAPPSSAAAAAAGHRRSEPGPHPGPPLAGGAEERVDEAGYDSDGVRVVYSSGPTPEQREAHAEWLGEELGRKLTWAQGSDFIDVWLRLPRGTCKGEVQCTVEARRLAVSLTWAGRVLDGPLTRRVKPSEAVWVLEQDAAPAAAAAAAGRAPGTTTLHVMLPKAERHYWRALFEGGEERSHVEVLKEAVEADEPLHLGQPGGELAPESLALLEELRERQRLVAAGLLNLDESFDDFRLAVGDNML